MTVASPTISPGEKLAYSVEEAAELLGISKTSAYQAAQRGELPSVIIGRRRLVPRAALDRLLAGDVSLPGATRGRRTPAARQAAP